MATRSQQFRYAQERSGKKKAPTRRRTYARPPSADAGARNLSRRAGRHASVASEESLSGKPSRKSSRSSVHHGKNSSVLERVSRMRSESPARRHAQR